MPDATTPTSGWEFNPDRSVTLWIDESPYRLRAPKFGEFRQIRDAFRQGTAEIRAMGASNARRAQELRELVKAGEMEGWDAQAEIRKLDEEVMDEAESLGFRLLTDAITVLCTKPLPPADDLPAWLRVQSVKNLDDLISHFTSTPPPHGVTT